MTENFVFQCATKIYFKPNGVGEIGKIIANDYSFGKVILLYGGSSLKKSGNYDKIVRSLTGSGVRFVEYGGIGANPDVEDVKKALVLARKFAPELVLAVGGGSVIDAGKSLAHAYYYDGDPLDFNKHLVVPDQSKVLPVATVLTLSASGSEMSDSCVISDRKTNFKGGFNSLTNYPLFSLLDNTLTYTVPPYQIGVGLVDMFSHSFERYFSPSNEIEPCDTMALAVMKEIVDVSLRICNDPSDEQASRAMMLLGSVAHNGFTQFGKGKKFIVHRAEHYLSGVYPTLAHGQGIALLLTRFLQINEMKLKDKTAKLGKWVFDLGSGCGVADVVSAMEKWLGSLPIFHGFDQLPFEVSKDDVAQADRLLQID